MKVITFLGSLREKSFNKALALMCLKLAPKDFEIEIIYLHDVPLFNADLEVNPPPVIKLLKEKVRLADGVLFISPEYNYSIPGVLKNAIDWLSRPPDDNVFSNKPCAIMSASTGVLGGARMQYHLRQVCVNLNMFVMNRPEFILPKAQEKFNEHLELIDKETESRIVKFLEAFKDWIKLWQNIYS